MFQANQRDTSGKHDTISRKIQIKREQISLICENPRRYTFPENTQHTAGIPVVPRLDGYVCILGTPAVPLGGGVHAEGVLQIHSGRQGRRPIVEEADLQDNRSLRRLCPGVLQNPSVPRAARVRWCSLKSSVDYMFFICFVVFVVTHHFSLAHEEDPTDVTLTAFTVSVFAWVSVAFALSFTSSSPPNVVRTRTIVRPSSLLLTHIFVLANIIYCMKTHV